MLSTSFASLGTAPLLSAPLFPAALMPQIDERHAHIYRNLLNAVYVAGIGLLKQNEESRAAAEASIAATLDELEATLSAQRFLLGPQLSAVDLRLCMTLLRFDCCYHKGFGIRTARGGVLCDATSGAASAYPSLAGYLREVYALIAPEVEWRAFRQYYRWAVGIAPGQPLPDVDMVKASAVSHGNCSPSPRERRRFVDCVAADVSRRPSLDC